MMLKYTEEESYNNSGQALCDVFFFFFNMPADLRHRPLKVSEHRRAEVVAENQRHISMNCFLRLGFGLFPTHTVFLHVSLQYMLSESAPVPNICFTHRRNDANFSLTQDLPLFLIIFQIEGECLVSLSI